MTNGQKGADELSKGISLGVGQKLHAFHMAVGNSIVSGAWMIALALVLVELIGTAATATLNSSSLAELARQRAATARWYELRNAELEASIDLSPLPSWTLAGFQIDPGGVSISFPAPEAARTLFVQYLAADNSSAGVLSFPVAAGESSIAIPSTEFGLSWTSGQTIILNLEQRAPDGRSVRYLGPGNVIRVP